MIILPTGFQKTQVTTFSVPEVGYFYPAEDITAHEIAKIFIMFVESFKPNTITDFKKYVEENNLSRHFKESTMMQSSTDSKN